MLLSEGPPELLTRLIELLRDGRTKRRASNSQSEAVTWKEVGLERPRSRSPPRAFSPLRSPPPSAVRRKEAMHLTAEQRQVLRLVREGKNVFFTGAAGCGKSVLLKELVRMLPETTTAVTASTGVAACNIGAWGGRREGGSAGGIWTVRHLLP